MDVQYWDTTNVGTNAGANALYPATGIRGINGEFIYLNQDWQLTSAATLVDTEISRHMHATFSVGEYVGAHWKSMLIPVRCVKN